MHSFYQTSEASISANKTAKNVLSTLKEPQEANSLTGLSKHHSSRAASLRTINLPMKIVAFFLRNDDEELSIDDAKDKFSVKYHTAQRALCRLAANGWLVRREVGNTSLYSINPAILETVNR